MMNKSLYKLIIFIGMLGLISSCSMMILKVNHNMKSWIMW